jgi:hypothetical protein
MIASLVSSTAAGMLTWSLAEHVIHNGLGHKLAKSRNAFSVEHTRHHATTSYFAASYKKAIAASLVTVAVAPLACAVAGARRGLAFTFGFAGAYLGYEVLHRRAHTHPPRGRYGRWVRKHHFHHHFHNPRVNHGVTSPIWDHLFGSYEAPTVVRVPVRHAMPWLIDETGEVRAEHRRDYALARKGSRRGSEPPEAHASAQRPPSA